MEEKVVLLRGASLKAFIKIVQLQERERISDIAAQMQKRG